MRIILDLKAWVAFGLMIFLRVMCCAQIPELIVQSGHSGWVKSQVIDSQPRCKEAGEPRLGRHNDEEFPGGLRPTDCYTVEGHMVTITVRLRSDGVEIANTQVVGTTGDVAAWQKRPWRPSKKRGRH